MFWVSVFFLHAGLLTGIKAAEGAKKYTVPIDLLTFDFEVLGDNNCETPPEDCVHDGRLSMG